MPEDVEEIVPENTLSFDNVAEGFRLFKTFLTSFMDRSMIWALNGYGHGLFYDMGTERKADIEEGMILFGNIFREMKKLKSQTKLQFRKVTPILPVPPPLPPLLPLQPKSKPDFSASSA